MSDHLIYKSATGRVDVMASDTGFDLRCPADLDAKLLEFANAGIRRTEIGVLPSAFRLLDGCLAGLLFGLTDAADDQLRAECERRHFPAMQSWLWDGLERLGMGGCFSDEQWARRVAELLTAERMAKSIPSMSTAERERDEWKRRAEAAEAAEADLQLAIKTGQACEAEGFMRGQAEMRERWAKFNAHEAMKMQEPGPGIAARDIGPDNSIAHLPEDLLCEDA